jgi:penicillin amidase
MRRLNQVLAAVAILVVVVIAVPAAVVGGIVAWLKLSPPPTNGEVKLAGLAAPVNLAWDSNAVPHIFAGSMRDAYRTLGWVHARDRLWQMETQRRIGQGRLSELVGKLGLDYDREMRVLGLYRLAEASYGALDPDVRADIDAYTAGVNAYLAHPAAPLPLEFQLLHLTPELWRAADSLVWGRLMSLQLSNNYRMEALRAELVKRIPPDAFKDMFPDSPAAGPTTLAALSGIDWRRFAGHLPAMLGPDHASNEWVVDGALTKSGKPLLANDPHLGLSAPILWYLVRIVTPEGSLSGATFPGVPFHIIGHNDRLGWGVTTTGGDTQDLFVELTAPDDGGKYLTPDGRAAFVTRDEVIKVRFGDDVHLTVRETRHGPVISDIDPDLAAAVGPNMAVALSFIGLDPADTTVAAIRAMDRAHDWPSFQAALKQWHSPEQNVVYADIDGHIGFTSVGVLPLRKKLPDDFPAPGATGAADWIGVTDFAQLPQAADPASHRFINANNRVVPPDYPTYVADDYGGIAFRAQRITDMLDGATAYTPDDFTRMQNDVKEQDADLLLPRLLRAKPADEPAQTAIKWLGDWNRTMEIDRPEPLIYSAWVSRLGRVLLNKRLGPGGDSIRSAYDAGLIVRLLDHFGPESDAILVQTLDDTLLALSKTYGSSIQSWRWGDAHRAALTSQLLGTIPVVGALFDIGLPAPGGSETVNRAGFAHGDGVHFPDLHGPGFREILDLSDLDSSRFIIATGESGSPVSPHFSDLSERWRDGKSIRLSGTIDQVKATGLGEQRFLP